jgi:hypothetical protein
LEISGISSLTYSYAGSTSTLFLSIRENCSALFPIVKEHRFGRENFGKKSLFSLRTIMDDSSWFGSNLTLNLHLREILQMMESYPKLIPNITKVVGHPKAYKWRHFHGEQERKIISKSTVILIVDLSSKGLDEEELEKLLQHHP